MWKGMLADGKASSSCATYPKHKTLGYFARSQLLYLARLPPKHAWGMRATDQQDIHPIHHLHTPH